MEGIDDKLETQKQWTADPCGASTAGELPPGTLAFFRKVEQERYSSYAPWMRAALRFEEHAGRDVLEIGPGLGTDHAQLARAGARCFALDLTETHLDLTRRRFELDGLVTRAVRGDAERLPFADARFDVVYSFGVIHHTPDMHAAVEEIRRVLRPGGRAVVGFYHRDSAMYWLRIILVRGLLRRQLFRKGYRRLLSEVEHRSPGSDAVPLVQVLSRARCRTLFSGFRELGFETHHVDWPHFLPLARPAAPAARLRLERLAGRLGWYLIVFARR